MKMKFKNGDKCEIVDSIMTHLIGKIVTIQDINHQNGDKIFYNVTIDDMNDCPLVASDKSLRLITEH